VPALAGYLALVVAAATRAPPVADTTAIAPNVAPIEDAAGPS